MTIQEILATCDARPAKTIDQKIASLVGSAPEALDTLKELASAINNDASFSTTITNALVNKVTKNNAIAAGTGTKITYDAKGLVISSTTLSESDIPSLNASKITQTSSNRFVTDVEKTDWGNKVTKNNTITAGTGTKVTYDAKGLVISSSNLSGIDLPKASASSLGAIKIGNGLLIDPDGILSIKQTISTDEPIDTQGNDGDIWYTIE